MRILLDCDGPLAVFVPYVFECVEADSSPVDHWDFFKFLTKDQAKEANRTLLHADFWRKLPVVNGAQEGVARLKEAGHDIHYVTSPWLSCFGWETARRDWLRKHFKARADHVHISDAKYIFSGDVFIDDKPDHVKEWEREQGENGRYAILFDSHHNKDFKWAKRFDWSKLDMEGYNWMLRKAA